MTLTFPDFDTFRLVLAGALVPPETLRGEAAFAPLPANSLAVEGAGKLTKKQAGDLAKLNVRTAKAMPDGAAAVSCWYQILPLVKETDATPLADQAPVLFELTSAADLAAVVTEMLRLGNDRQSFRWFGDGDAQKVLLRVVGPPYYTLLRAIDRLPGEGDGPIRAYVERSPRLWVQMGYAHPMADVLQPPDDRLVLMRPERDWTYLADEPFRDAYEVLDFTLPAETVEWSPVAAVEPFEVPLKLVQGNAADVPEFWVFRVDAVEALDAFVRDAEERQVQRLRFAVGTAPDGAACVVLRATASKVGLPVLALPQGVAFRSYQRLPNLYVPVGARLHPQLRRDAVRGLLAANTDRTVWLMPGPGGGFVPESIEENAFRPLEEWVDYQIAEAQEPLRAWVAASRFDFQSFQCLESGGPKPKGPDDRPRPEPAKPKKNTDPKPPTASAEPVAPAVPGFQPAAEAVPPSEWQRRRAELQARFLAAPGTLDDPAKRDLWPDLARANTGAGDAQEAATCWLNALWRRDDPPAAYADGWLAAEGITAGIVEEDFVSRLRSPKPSAADVRALAAILFAASVVPPPWLAGYLPEAQRYFEERDGSLPIRAAWLVGVRLARLAGGDPLGLARLRDRLLERLLDDGLNAEIDLPFFLRNGDAGDTEAARGEREKAHEIHGLVQAWSARAASAAGTPAYIDLLFAYGFARLGESRKARELLDSAEEFLNDGTEGTVASILGRYLAGAFRFRIEAALAGKRGGGSLAPGLLEELRRITEAGKGRNSAPEAMAAYVIGRMRDVSRVLEPIERTEPYGQVLSSDELRKLADVHNPGPLAAEIRKLFRNAAKEPRAAASLLKETLPLAHRVGEEFAVEMLGRIGPAFAAAGSVAPEPAANKLLAAVLERGFLLAAHYERKAVARELAELFLNHLDRSAAEAKTEWVALGLSHALRSLRKLGLRDDATLLLKQVRAAIHGDLPPEKLAATHAHQAARWANELVALLGVAGGLARLDSWEAASPILDLAEGELTARPVKLLPLPLAAATCAYLAALGQAPPQVALARIARLFHRLDPDKLATNYVTSAFQWFHVKVAEAAVLAICGDDSAVAAGGRRWLEEDEQIVRRRIHRDLAAATSSAVS